MRPSCLVRARAWSAVIKLRVELRRGVIRVATLRVQWLFMLLPMLTHA